jgi:F0F1-type ATP synthase membrane subunit c/vacuolar-type H+-ATPase subunit K
MFSGNVLIVTGILCLLAGLAVGFVVGYAGRDTNLF